MKRPSREEQARIDAALADAINLRTRELEAEDEKRRAIMRRETPAGFVRASSERCRFRGEAGYVDHLVRQTGEHAEDPALCGARPEHTYWTQWLLGGSLCPTCAALAAACPAPAERAPADLSLDDEASRFCALEGA